MPFHDGHLASARPPPIVAELFAPSGFFPSFDVDVTQSSDSSVARPILRVGARFSRALPILRGVRASLDRVLRPPVKGAGAETIRGAFFRSPARAIERCFAFPFAPPAGGASPSRELLLGGCDASVACRSKRRGVPFDTSRMLTSNLSPRLPGAAVPLGERRTHRASLGCDFVKPMSTTRFCARARARELSILFGCAAPLSDCGGRARGMSPSRFARRLAPAEEPCHLSSSLARLSRCASPPYGGVSSGPWRARKRRDEGAALVAETSSMGRDFPSEGHTRRRRWQRQSDGR